MSYKCRFCPQCNGKACYGELPGMGCPEGNHNFFLNYEGWKNLKPTLEQQDLYDKGLIHHPQIILAPMAGAIENIGYESEEAYYPDMMKAAKEAGAVLSIGDGTPDEKLHLAANAVRKTAEDFPGTKAHVFLKPYPNQKLMERIEWTEDMALSFGIDIDSYNILTMRNKAHLEKKTAPLLKEIMDIAHHKGLPFIVKGVFTIEDIEMVKELKPDVIYISNHGGRVNLPQGSTAAVLKEYGKELLPYASELWVDGGIRDKGDLIQAALLGAGAVGIGRPFASALCKGGKEAVKELVKSFN